MTRWRVVAALLSGLIFGFGLSLSGMLDPERVLGFLDVAGRWNASLAFVLAGAVITAAAGQRFAQRLGRPLFEGGFAWPRVRPVDARLVTGSAIFGTGWGLSGLCPGPAVAAVVLELEPIIVFTTAMLIGMLVYRWRFAATTPRG